MVGICGRADATCATTIQANINSAVAAGGGTVTIPAGPCDLSAVSGGLPGLLISGTSTSNPDGTTNGSNIRLVGSGEGATVLHFAPTSGTGPALLIQGYNSGSPIPLSNISIEDLTIDLSVGCGTTSSTRGFVAVNTQWLTLKNLEVRTSQGCSSVLGQTGIQFIGIGTNQFVGYVTAINPHIHGDFTTGVDLTSDGSPDALTTATTWIGGSIVQTSASKAGTGMLIEHGDSNKLYNTDFENWDTALDVGWSFNGPLAGRFEQNTHDFTVESTVLNTDFTGAGLTAASNVDNGSGTIYGLPLHTAGSPGGTPLNPCQVSAGSGSPVGTVTGKTCDMYFNTSGGATSTLYVYTSTGWVAK
jgi:hypothetical protein